ncbi:MAG: hypothetical protein ABW157_09470 [Candidatus Thiodiazotropha sp. LLP2]
MIKRLSTSIIKWLRYILPQQQDTQNKVSDIDNTRRRFFKRTAIGAVTVTSTAGIAKTIVDSIPKPNLKNSYIKDAVSGENELKQRKFVLMSVQEKEEMVQSFIDGTNNQS